MTATFAPTTDRPRLFDDRPTRARRPARPAPRPRTSDRTPPAPELIPREPATAPREPAVEPPDPAAPAPAPRDERPAGADASRHALTLDHLISGVWDDLTAHRTVTCPACHGQMTPRYGSAEQPVGGRCRRCGSSLG